MKNTYIKGIFHSEKRKIVKEKKYIIRKLSENEYNKKAVYIFKQPDKMFLIEP